MNADSVIIHSIALTTEVSKKSLSEGNSVFVRVLENNENNSYKVSFGGNVFFIKSDIALKEGQSFLAKVKIEGRKVLLIQQLDKNISKMILNKIDGAFDKSGNITDLKLASYFEKIGLPPDSISYTLFEQMKMIGMKFDLSIMQKARLIAKKFVGKERQAAQIALILEEKKIPVSEEYIESILDDEYTEADDSKDSKNNFENKSNENIAFLSEKDNGLNARKIEIIFKNFFDRILNRELNNKDGILSLFNHSGFLENDISFLGNWIKIPFEMSFSESDDTKISGFLSFFLKPDIKNIEKGVLKFNFDSENYAFVLSFNENKCIKIKTSLNYPVKIMDIPIEYVNSNDIFDFADNNESVSIMDGFI